MGEEPALASGARAAAWSNSTRTARAPLPGALRLKGRRLGAKEVSGECVIALSQSSGYNKGALASLSQPPLLRCPTGGLRLIVRRSEGIL